MTDFSYVVQPKDDWFFGMHTAQVGSEPPKNFEIFHFFIDKAPEHAYEIFNIPADVMFKAGLEAGWQKVEYFLQYPDPEFKDHPVIKRYNTECNPTDYFMKFY